MDVLLSEVSKDSMNTVPKRSYMIDACVNGNNYTRYYDGSTKVPKLVVVDFLNEIFCDADKSYIEANITDAKTDTVLSCYKQQGKSWVTVRDTDTDELCYFAFSFK